MFWVGMTKNGCGQSGYGTLKMKVSQECTSVINWFLHYDKNSGKLKVASMIFE